MLIMQMNAAWLPEFIDDAKETQKQNDGGAYSDTPVVE